MSTLSVRLPNSVHNAVKTFAQDDGISINQFIISAVIEKMTALDAEKYIEKRALKGDRDSYINVLKKVPHVAPRDDDV